MLSVLLYVDDCRESVCMLSVCCVLLYADDWRESVC